MKLIPKILFGMRQFGFNEILRLMYKISRQFEFLKKLSEVIRSDLDPKNLSKLPSSNLTFCRGVFGERQKVNLNDHIGWRFFLDGYFELETPLLAKMMFKDGIIKEYIDIGAHIGLELIPIALCGIKSIGFEPSHQTYSNLLTNIKLNKLKNVRTYNLGAFSSNTKKILYTPSLNHGASSIHQNWHDSSVLTDEATIDLVRLDSINELNVDNALLKIDVEGAESSVLDGLGESLKFNPILIFEFYKDKNNILDLTRVKNYLKNNYSFKSVSADLVGKNRIELSLIDFDFSCSKPSVIGVPNNYKSWLASQDKRVLNLK